MTMAMARWLCERTMGRITERITMALLAVCALALVFGEWRDTARAQTSPVSVGLTVEPETVELGQEFAMTLSANHPSDYHISFPRLRTEEGGFGTFDAFEIVSQTPLETVYEADGTLTTAIEVRAALFEIGSQPTPQMSVTIRRPDGSIVNRPARRSSITVKSEFDTSGDSRSDSDMELAPQMQVPAPQIWPTALAGSAALLLLTLGAGYYWRDKLISLTQRKRDVIPSPRELALWDLDALDELDLPAQAEFAEHYARLSDVLKVFVLRRFGVSAPAMTTRQILESLEDSACSPDGLDELASALEESELVKFAGMVLDPDSARESVETARRAVNLLDGAALIRDVRYGGSERTGSECAGGER